MGLCRYHSDCSSSQGIHHTHQEHLYIITLLAHNIITHGIRTAVTFVDLWTHFNVNRTSLFFFLKVQKILRKSNMPFGSESVGVLLSVRIMLHC